MKSPCETLCLTLSRKKKETINVDIWGNNRKAYHDQMIIFNMIRVWHINRYYPCMIHFTSYEPASPDNMTYDTV